MNNPLDKLAVKWLTYRLGKDRSPGSWYYSYQSNIAMCIFDEAHKHFPLTTSKGSPTLHEFCNICAKRFLDLWIGNNRPSVGVEKKGEK